MKINQLVEEMDLIKVYYCKICKKLDDGSGNY